MALVRNTLLLPGGDPSPQRVNTQVRIQLINGGFAVTGAPAEPEILGQFNIPVDSQGFWQIDLIPNEQIDPDGTYYRVEETAGRVSAVHHFIVPRFVDVLSSSRTSNVVTATLETAEHGVRVGDSITVDLADNTYDGTFTVTSVNGAIIQWSQVAANDASGGTGIVNKTVWDLYDLIIDQPPGVVNLVAPPSASLAAAADSLALSRWRQRLAVARKTAGGTGPTIVFIGDSITEGIGISTGSYRQARFIERLRRRFNGILPGIQTWTPASNNIFNAVGDGAWPGGDDPWTYTGAVTGDLSRGVSWHAASVPTTGTASLTFFGQYCIIVHSQTVDGPTAASVTLDGAAIATLDGRNDPEINGANYLATADGYGHHTIVIDPNDGPLVLEGFQVYEPDSFFFVPINSAQVIDAGHSGYQASVWGADGIFPFPGGSQWTFSLGDGTMGLIVVLLGVNDQGSVTPGQFEDNLVGIVQRWDVRAGNNLGCFLFVALPGVPSTLANAMGSAAVRVGSGRAAALDLAALRPNRTFGSDLSGDGTHPNDAGNLWLAEVLGEVLDPSPPTQPPVTPHRIQIDAANPPLFRLNWTEATTPISGSALLYDEAGASAVRERRHRVWLDPGTYQVNVTADHAAGRGQLEILGGRWNSNTPTLTSLGTVDTSVGTGITTTELATTIVTSAAGYVPIYVRKTNQANIARFVQLSINRISPSSP